MSKLIILQGDQHRLYELKEKVATVGRAPDNTLWLDDPSLSRRHCELRLTNAQWWLHDKGSFNGTFINNLSCSAHRLVPGDRIQLGTTVMYFVGGGAGDAVEKTAPHIQGPDSGRAAEEAKEREATSRKLRNFMALLEITKAVSQEINQENLLKLVVQKSIQLISAERGFLILKRDEGISFEVALKSDGSIVENPEGQISRSVIEGVTTSGEPVITINAQNDLGSFMSIVALEVRSLICVPLRMKEKILGALYVDSHISEHEFTEESLNLLQAFADQAAIALENAALYKDVLESKEQETRIRQTFQKYVPADVVNRVLGLAEGSRLSERTVATVLFSDIRSFTSISEGLQPEEVVTFLNDYLQRMVDIVFEEGGIVDKFIGDAVMAIWGAPMSKPDDALRGVRAAVRMLEEVENFNRDQRTKGGVEIEIGIGLHTGPLIAGNIGSDKKMEYTCIGDTVNVASRVESLNKNLKTKLLITEDTRQAATVAGGHFNLKAMPPVPVKGKSEKLFVYEVLREPTPEGTSTAPVPPPAEAHPVPQLVNRGTREVQSPVGADTAPNQQVPVHPMTGEPMPQIDPRYGGATMRLSGDRANQSLHTPGQPGQPGHPQGGAAFGAAPGPPPAPGVPKKGDDFFDIPTT